MTTKPRLEWVDTTKGLGIVLVVAGHVFSGAPSDLVFLFHMPLFFMLSGYLSRPDDRMRHFARRKAAHLLVPYAAFLAVLGVPFLIAGFLAHGTAGAATAALRLMLGGRMLGGSLGVFWFVTCLYITQQVMNYALCRWAPGQVAQFVAICLGLAYLNALYPDFWLPWNANVVAATIPFFYLGYLCRSRTAGARVLLGAAALFLLGAWLALRWHVTLTLKYVGYGIPLVSFAVAAAGSVLLMAACQRLASVPGAGSVLRRLGALSIPIMFLHQPLQVALRSVPGMHSELLRFGGCCLGSWLIGELLNRWPLTRRWFLGAAEPRAAVGIMVKETAA